MSDELDQLLRRPAVVAAVRDLGVASLALEDVLTALQALGQVRIDVDEHPDHPYVCLLDAGAEHGRGRTVLHAAVACWAEALASLGQYTDQGFNALERFLLDPDVA